MKVNLQRLSVILITLVFISTMQLSTFAKQGTNKGIEKESVQATSTKVVEKVAPANFDVQLTSIQKKETSVSEAVYGIAKEIDTYIKVTIPTAVISPTPAPIKITPAKVKNINGFVNGTTGKLNALTKRLAVVEKELKALSVKNPGIKSNAKYIILDSNLALIKASIKAQNVILDGLKKITKIKK